MHMRVPTGVYDGEVVDVYFDNPNQCCAGDGFGAQASALTRARSGAMLRKRGRSTTDPDKETPYSISSAAYLYRRNRTLAQNEHSQQSGIPPNATPGMVGSFDKVTAAEHVWRLRYNATMQTGPPMTAPYGVMQLNALAFVHGARIFDIKDRIGAPYPCHAQSMIARCPASPPSRPNGKIANPNFEVSAAISNSFIYMSSTAAKAVLQELTASWTLQGRIGNWVLSKSIKDVIWHPIPLPSGTTFCLGAQNPTSAHIATQNVEIWAPGKYQFTFYAAPRPSPNYNMSLQLTGSFGGQSLTTNFPTQPLTGTTPWTKFSLPESTISTPGMYPVTIAMSTSSGGDAAIMMTKLELLPGGLQFRYKQSTAIVQTTAPGSSTSTNTTANIAVTGTVVSAPATFPRRGYVTVVSGSNSTSINYLTISNFTMPTTAFTIAGWFNLTETGTGTTDGDIITFRSTNSKYFPAVAVRMQGQMTSAPKFRCIVSNGTFAGQRYADTTVITTSAWNHFAMTYDGYTICSYLNGAACASVSSGAPALIRQAVMMGDTISGRFLNGSLDDLQIYNNALSAGQVLTLTY